VWNFQVYIPGFQNPLAKDDVISVTSSFSDSPWFGHESDLEVRDENGALLFYVGEGGDTATLNPPEGYAVSFGEALCSGESSCGSWIHSELVVTSGDESVAVPYLGSSTLGGRRVVHGGAETQTSSGFHGCFDWGVGRAALAIHSLD
jgi:hypothetical protein